MAKQLGKVAVTVCLTTVLMIFNLALFCSGMLMIALGVWMKFRLQNCVDMAMDRSDEALLGLMLLGKVVAIIGILACCCTSRQHPPLLYLYGGFLAVITLFELSTGALLYTYRDALVEGFDQGLNNSLNACGADKNKSFHIDLMQRMLHCCGNRGYADWLNLSPPSVVPSSCCSVQEGECDTTDTEDIYTEGCYNRVMFFIRSNMGIVAGSAFGISFFPMVGVVLSCCLASHINRVNQE